MGLVHKLKQILHRAVRQKVVEIYKMEFQIVLILPILINPESMEQMLLEPIGIHQIMVKVS